MVAKQRRLAALQGAVATGDGLKAQYDGHLQVRIVSEKASPGVTLHTCGASLHGISRCSAVFDAQSQQRGGSVCDKGMSACQFPTALRRCRRSATRCSRRSPASCRCGHRLPMARAARQLAGRRGVWPRQCCCSDAAWCALLLHRSPHPSCLLTPLLGAACAHEPQTLANPDPPQTRYPRRSCTRPPRRAPRSGGGWRRCTATSWRR